jgi:hypothetical protein
MKNMKKFKNEFIKNDGGRSIYHRCDRQIDNAGDCVIRACAIALKMDYMDVKKQLFAMALENGFMPNSHQNYEPFLNQHGWFKKSPLKDRCGRKYQLGMMPVFDDMIVKTTGHVVAVVDGVVNDTWDCRDYCSNSYYIKQK